VHGVWAGVSMESSPDERLTPQVPDRSVTK
jgi:hypothetical protein